MGEPPAKRIKHAIFEGIVSNEIWAIVFSFLDATSLAHVSSVCFTWASLADHPLLWKSLCYPYADERLLKHPSATWKRLCILLTKVSPSQNAIIKTASITKYCEVCSTPATQRCSVCKSIYYCSVNHQLQDYKAHRMTCTSAPFTLYSSLEKALGKFRAGDTFFLCRGTFSTTSEIEITVPIHLIGLGGDNSQVKILHQGQSWSVIVVVGCKCDITGVTVLHNSLMLPGHCMTTLRGAEVLVDRCVFSNMSRTSGLGTIGGATCVNICEGSNAIIKNCEIVNTRKHGIFVGEGAQAIIENNTIHKVHASGIYVVSEGQAAIRRNRIFDCANHGVLVGNDGMAEICYNEIRNVKGMGVRVLREDAETNPLVIKENNMTECLAEFIKYILTFYN